MKRKRIDCLGLGIMPLDILFTVPHLPEIGGKVDATQMTIQGGGPIPNVMVGLARLGHRTAIITALGHDFAGKVGVEEIRNEGVSAQYIVWKKGSSDTAVGYVEAKDGRRTIALCRGVSVNPRDLKTASYPLPRIVHLDGRDLPACIKLAQWAKKVGAVVAFDIGSIRNDVSPIFHLVDHLIVADSYALPFTKSHTAKESVEKLRAHCPGTVVVTQGIKGGIGCENNSWVKYEAFPVETVDTTGAGDAFHTGYLYGLLNHLSFGQRLKIGAAVGALKCTRPGARTGLPNLARLQKFLKQHQCGSALQC